MLETIENKSLYEIVFERIKKSIIENELKPGEKLTAESVSIELGVSRTPVSNALKALEVEGYVDIYPQNGTYVKVLSKEELESIYDLREAIEGLVARLIIKTIDKEKLQEYLEKFKNFLELESYDESSVHEFYNLELEFHDYLVGNCPKIIKNEIQNIIDLTKRSRKLILQAEVSKKEINSIKEKDINIHIKIIEALLNDDVEMAEKYSKKDVRDTKFEALNCLY